MDAWTKIQLNAGMGFDEYRVVSFCTKSLTTSLWSKFGYHFYKCTSGNMQALLSDPGPPSLLFGRHVVAARSKSIISCSHLLQGWLKTWNKGRHSWLRGGQWKETEYWHHGWICCAFWRCLLQDCGVSPSSRRQILSQLIQADRRCNLPL